MIESNDNRLFVRIEDDPFTDTLILESFATFLVAAGTLYRSIRVAQYLYEQPEEERAGRAAELMLYDPYFDSWLSMPSTAAVRVAVGDSKSPIPPLVDLIQWVGGFTIAGVDSGSILGELAAFGKGAGEGIAAAVKGTAQAIVTLIISPAEFRQQWALGREMDADARIKAAEARAKELDLDALAWAWRVMKGEQESLPRERILAGEVLIGREQISQAALDKLLSSWDRPMTQVEGLGRAGHLRADARAA